MAGDSHVLLAAAQPVGDGYVQHLARLQVKSERAAPSRSESGQPTIFVSPTGTGAVVVWESDSSLTYVETVTDEADTAWSESYTPPDRR